MATATARGQQGKAYSAEELDALMRDALGELMADGTAFGRLGVERIIRRAGVARSTFYGRYRDKAGLINALSSRTLSRLYAGARTWISLGADATRADIERGMGQVLATYLEDEAVMRAVAEAAASDHAVREAYEAGVEGYGRALARMIRRGVKDGRMRAVSPADTASVLAWTTESTIRHTAAASPRRRDAMIAALADVVWTTLFDEEA